ncbi:hypothetical protein UQW22_02920 [Isoptericola halotolerans]|uniref:hypothetical protein n=1 Tax=Isoptericola halotolerans TaxID=300560 RepID=UPI00388F6058
MTRRLARELGVVGGPAGGLLVLMWTVLAGLVLAHVGFRTWRVPADPGYGLGRDRGYGDVYFTVLVVWVVLMCLLLAVRHRSVLLAAWATAFGVLAVDDWFGLHERFGVVIGARLGTTSGLGELVWLGGLALVIGVLLVVGHLRAGGPVRATSTLLMVLCAGLFVCGVVVDAVHAAVSGEHWNTVALVVEDGGEIAVLCVVVSFLFAVTFCGHRPAPFAGRWRRLRPAGPGPRPR